MDSLRKLPAGGLLAPHRLSMSSVTQSQFAKLGIVLNFEAVKTPPSFKLRTHSLKEKFVSSPNSYKLLNRTPGAKVKVFQKIYVAKLHCDFAVTGSEM